MRRRADASRTKSRFACVPAALYCWSMFSELQELVSATIRPGVDVNRNADTVQGLNMYDVRRKCDKSKDKDGPVSRVEFERFATGEPVALVA